MDKDLLVWFVLSAIVIDYVEAEKGLVGYRGANGVFDQDVDDKHKLFYKDISSAYRFVTKWVPKLMEEFESIGMASNSYLLGEKIERIKTAVCLKIVKHRELLWT